MVAVPVAILLAILLFVGASFASAQSMDGADQEMIDVFLAQQAALAKGTGGIDTFAGAQAKCRTVFELELQQSAARRDGIVEAKAKADVGPGTIISSPRPPAFGTVRIIGTRPDRERADVQLELIAGCLSELSWNFGMQQALYLKIFQRLEAQMQAIGRELAELKRER